MNNTNIIRTVSKIFGLYFIIQTVMNLRDIFFYVFGTWDNEFNEANMMTLYLSLSYSALFNFTIGLVFIFKADWITKRINPVESDNLNIDLTKTDWIELALIVISGIVIINSIPEIMHKLVSYVYFNDYGELEKQLYWTNQNKANLFYSIFKFVVGLFFLLNARNFSQRLKRIGDKDDNLGE